MAGAGFEPTNRHREDNQVDLRRHSCIDFEYNSHNEPNLMNGLSEVVAFFLLGFGPFDSHSSPFRSSPFSARRGRPILNRPLRRPRTRLSKKAKLNLTLASWKQNGISLEDFLGAWGRQEGRSHSADVATTKKILQKPDIINAIGFPRATSALNNAVFHSEFKALIERPLFNRSDTVEMVDKLDDIDFSQARREIPLHAPDWAKLLNAGSFRTLARVGPVTNRRKPHKMAPSMQLLQ